MDRILSEVSSFQRLKMQNGWYLEWDTEVSLCQGCVLIERELVYVLSVN